MSSQGHHVIDAKEIGLFVSSDSGYRRDEGPTIFGKKATLDCERVMALVVWVAAAWVRTL